MLMAKKLITISKSNVRITVTTNRQREVVVLLDNGRVGKIRISAVEAAQFGRDLFNAVSILARRPVRRKAAD